MKEILIRMFDTIRDELNLLTIIFAASIAIWFIWSIIDTVNSEYDAIQETISDEDSPNQNDLKELTTFRKFQKAQPEFQTAVHEKLKTYNIVPTAIEKTMSPAQLYKANNPLWMSDFNVEAIRVIFILEDKLGRNVVANTCVDEFMLDCKNGIRPINALEKQLRKHKIH